MNIIPIATTTIDWKGYLLAAKKAMGKSISTVLDNNGLSADSLASFIITLAHLHDPVSNPNALITEAGNLLHHASFGFLTILDTETLIELMELTAVHVYSVPLDRNNRFVVVSGSLAEWRVAVIACLAGSASTELRILVDEILLYFEKVGLGQVWGKYRKTVLTDKTFILR